MTNDYRAKAQDLCMNDAMPFQQQFQYRTTLPLREVIHERFFLPVANNLRTGDQIRIVGYDRPAGPRHDGRVVEVAEVIVTDKRPEAIVLDLLGEIREIATPAVADTTAEPRLPRERYVPGTATVAWNLGKRAFEIKVGETVVATEPDKDRAHQMARGDIPLPPESEAA